MTPSEFLSARKALGLNQAQLGDKIGITDRMIRHYERGDHKVPKVVGMLLARLVDERHRRIWKVGGGTQ